MLKHKKAVELMSNAFNMNFYYNQALHVVDLFFLVTFYIIDALAIFVLGSVQIDQGLQTRYISHYTSFLTFSVFF